MAKTKHRPTAAQRREEVKSQRQQRLSAGTGKQDQSRQQRDQSHNNDRRTRNTRKSLPWGLVVGVLLVLAAVIAVFIVVAQQSSNKSSSSGSSASTPAPASVVSPVTNVSAGTLATVGTGGVKNFLVPVNKSGSGSQQPPLVGPTGKPEFFYYGAEYCPYCAAERWGVIVALSRFGSFANLHLTTSSADDVFASTPTFTFYKSTYTSQYIDFVSVESEGQTQGVPLQTPTAEQQQIFSTYDGPPYVSSSDSIPFIDIGNRFLTQGASYEAGVLRSNPQDPSSAPLSQQDVANALSNQDSAITKGIVGTANYLTAAICQATNQQPASVCSAAPIPHIEQSLGKAAFNNTESSAAGLVYGHFDVSTRRQD